MTKIQLDYTKGEVSFVCKGSSSLPAQLAHSVVFLPSKHKISGLISARGEDFVPGTAPAFLLFRDDMSLAVEDLLSRVEKGSFLFTLAFIFSLMMKLTQFCQFP